MKSHYFDHDYSARNDQKILRLRARHGWEGYGIYWAILETMAEDSTGYMDRGAIEGLSAGYGVPIDRLKKIISDCVEIDLFAENDDGTFYSRRMIEHKRNMTDFTENGRIGAKKRWGNRGAIGGAIEGVMQSRVNNSKEKEKKEEENKEYTRPAEPVDVRYKSFIAVFDRAWKDSRTGAPGYSKKDFSQLKALLKRQPSANDTDFNTACTNCICDSFNGKNFSLSYVSAKYELLINLKKAGANGTDRRRYEFEQGLDGKYANVQAAQYTV